MAATATAPVEEATADQAQSFARVQWLTEAALEYQWIVDNHPRSRQAGDAKEKVTRIRGRIEELKSWQARVDAFMAESKKRMCDPRYLDKAKSDAGELSSAPFSFVTPCFRRFKRRQMWKCMKKW